MWLYILNRYFSCVFTHPPPTSTQQSKRSTVKQENSGDEKFLSQYLFVVVGGCVWSGTPLVLLLLLLLLLGYSKFSYSSDINITHAIFIDDSTVEVTENAIIHKFSLVSSIAESFQSTCAPLEQREAVLNG